MPGRSHAVFVTSQKVPASSEGTKERRANPSALVCQPHSPTRKAMGLPRAARLISAVAEHSRPLELEEAGGRELRPELPPYLLQLSILVSLQVSVCPSLKRVGWPI